MRPEKRVTARSNEPQKKCEGLVLPRIARAKVVEHAVGLHELAPERVRGGRIVARVHAILLERDRALDLHRHGPDGYIDIERAQRTHHRRVEFRRRHRRKRDALLARVAGVQHELVRAEIEIDLQRAAAIGHCAGRESARAHIEHDAPPVVRKRRQRELHLADDLGPQMQRVAGVGPVLVGESRPGV